MGLLSTIRADSLAARKSKSPSSSVLTTLRGELDTKTKSLSPARDLTDAEVLAVVQKFIKSIDETIIHLEKNGSAEALATARAERAALEVYLPKQMTEAELEAFVQAKVAEGANMGQIMQALKAEHGGQYDGKLASQIAKRYLAAA
ncbi:GatB/YqeY domain-containing protein [Salipiger mucosus]|uniref:Transamidase GatB domain protein n=1 Tax=Salipiger mucosus DSM 16094 TaxID=1123237 RepID=S9QDY3_9RHOB|nr:GatB/YqeY domain-containing protein [Salipiger mucosus]EPX78097.1 hypothetical protein Salmuc_03434 [Salipiger mucosus DSM 16094]